MTAAAILAGGRATRLDERDKSSLAFGSERLLDRQVAALRRVADHVFIVSSRHERQAAGDLPVVADAFPGGGVLGGLYTALQASPAPQTLVVACDLPFLTTTFLRHLAETGRDADIAIPRSADGYQPLCASYSRTCLPVIRRQLDDGRLKVVDLLQQGLRVREIGPDDLARFDPEGWLFFNVNTLEDYARALNKLSRQNR